MEPIIYTYTNYQVPIASKLPYILWYYLSEVSNGRREPALTQAQNILKEYALPLAEKFFNEKLRVKSKGQYGIYMCATRHLITAFLTKDEQNIGSTVSEMWFCNLQIIDNNQPENIEQPPDGIPEKDPTTNEQKTYISPYWTPNFIIKEIRIWKLTIEDMNSLYFSWTPSITMGIRSRSKFPVLGITEKKLNVPPYSFFMEGMHINCFGYPYVFLQVYNSTGYKINENWFTNAIASLFYTKS